MKGGKKFCLDLFYGRCKLLVVGIFYGGLVFLEVDKFFKKSFKRLELFNFGIFIKKNINNRFNFLENIGCKFKFFIS